jgi:hypothetical protein
MSKNIVANLDTLALTIQFGTEALPVSTNP